MKYWIILLILSSLTLLSCSKESKTFKESKIYSANLGGVYEKIDGTHNIEETKKRYVEIVKKLDTKQLFNGTDFRLAIEKYNSKIGKTDDPIDSFVGTLPESYRMHFTLVHNSFSLQKATPLAPRVLMVELMKTTKSKKVEIILKLSSGCLKKSVGIF